VDFSWGFYITDVLESKLHVTDISHNSPPILSTLAPLKSQKFSAGAHLVYLR
jgi:hypothetical protein